MTRPRHPPVLCRNCSVCSTIPNKDMQELRARRLGDGGHDPDEEREAHPLSDLAYDFYNCTCPDCDPERYEATEWGWFIGVTF